MHHFDSLPAPVRRALANANAALSAEQVAMVWKMLPMLDDLKIDYLLATIQANDRPPIV